MKIKALLLISFTVLLAACSGTHMLPKGQKLYTGATVALKKDGKITDKSVLESDATSVLKPKTNQTFFGFFRPKLWIYEVMGTPKKNKGIRYSIKTKLGEPPVLFSRVSTPNTSAFVKNRLQNDGYFHVVVTPQVIEKKRKVSVIYTANLGEPYLIKKITFPSTNSELGDYISRENDKSLLKTGDIYNLDKIKAERERIDESLKENGYFYFSPDYILLRADTSLDNNVNLTLVVKDETPEEAFFRYRINKIIINPNYSLRHNTAKQRPDTLLVNGKYYVNNDSTLKPGVVTNSVFFTHDAFYNRHDHDLTLSRAMGVGIFKYINIKFDPIEIKDTSFLNVNITLTQVQKKSLRAELLGVSKSTNYAGPSLDLSFRNRNFLRGSELFILEEQASVETQVSKHIPGQPSLGSFDINTSAKLYFPRFVTPFHVSSTSQFVPKTEVELSFDRTYHFSYFTLNNFQADYGYVWNESKTKIHELKPLVVNYVTLQNTSAKFDSLLHSNLLLKDNFQQQFIVGSQYSFLYNSQLSRESRSEFYFKGTVEVAGNLLSLYNVTANSGVDAENPKKLFGSPYSQFTRFDIDTRYFYNFSSNRKLATRIIGGIGIPYGNSGQLPYISQFFIGGSNSLRAFRSRTLGPGTYPPPSGDSLSFFEQAGDIKIEMNAEYRFGIISIIKGAVFADAGNIWLLHNDPTRPGGEFTANFYKEFAVGTGAGLRFDASFLIIRLDLAFPLRKPWLPENQRWVLNQIDFGSSAWRRDNLVLNIAIGYPF